MTSLARLLARARRALAALLCDCDVHDLPAGFHRVGPDECDYSRPIVDIRCRWCAVLFAAQTDDPDPELENRVEREMARHRARCHNHPLRRPS